MDLSLSRSVESIELNIDPGSFVGFSVRYKQVPRVQHKIPVVQHVKTLRALNFSIDLTHFEVLQVPHAVDQILRFFAEWVVRLILPQIRFSIWMRFELMNHLVDYFFACMVFLFTCDST